MGTLLEDLDLSGKTAVFKDRREAGQRLAARLSDRVDGSAIVLAIPAGGVPVALPIAQSLRLPLDVLVVRKIQIPGNTEAGFGAIGPDGTVLLNDRIVEDLRLSAKEIEVQVSHAREVLERREALFRRGRPFPSLENRQVILVDDGLASGYTMLASAALVKARGASQVIVAVPTASRRTANFLLPEVDMLVCPNIRTGPIFAVADAYRHWYDLDDREVLDLLREADAAEIAKS
jgi:putative phosphoribosyl transferase